MDKTAAPANIRRRRVYVIGTVADPFWGTGSKKQGMYGKTGSGTARITGVREQAESYTASRPKDMSRNTCAKSVKSEKTLVKTTSCAAS